MSTNLDQTSACQHLGTASLSSGPAAVPLLGYTVLVRSLVFELMEAWALVVGSYVLLEATMMPYVSLLCLYKGSIIAGSTVVS